jgi:LmbE family N-acetylglucosaminyl deacetylase
MRVRSQGLSMLIVGTCVIIIGFLVGFVVPTGQGDEIKTWFEALRKRTSPDVILCHWRDDAHQDHREVSRLTWNTFRDHAILEYEIPKWDGDTGRPNVYVPASKTLMERKTKLLHDHFASQRSKDWFE